MNILNHLDTALAVYGIAAASNRGRCGWWFPFLWLRLIWGATGRCF